MSNMALYGSDSAGDLARVVEGWRAGRAYVSLPASFWAQAPALLPMPARFEQFCSYTVTDFEARMLAEHGSPDGEALAKVESDRTGEQIYLHGGAVLFARTRMVPGVSRWAVYSYAWDGSDARRALALVRLA